MYRQLLLGLLTADRMAVLAVDVDVVIARFQLQVLAEFARVERAVAIGVPVAIVVPVDRSSASASAVFVILVVAAFIGPANKSIVVVAAAAAGY